MRKRSFFVHRHRCPSCPVCFHSLAARPHRAGLAVRRQPRPQLCGHRLDQASSVRRLKVVEAKRSLERALPGFREVLDMLLKTTPNPGPHDQLRGGPSGRDSFIASVPGKRDSIHHDLLEVTSETATATESRLKLLHTAPSLGGGGV